MDHSNPEAIKDLLPSRASHKNFAAAQQAIRHVRRQLPRRDANQRLQPRLDVDRNRFPMWITGRLEQLWVLNVESEMVQQSIADWPMSTRTHRLANEAMRNGGGSAAEQAIVAFAYLLQLGIRPLDYMHTSGREHAFVVIGRVPPVMDGLREHKNDDQGVEIMLTPNEAIVEIKPETWGVDAVVCDPHRGVSYRQVELINTEYYYDYYPAESQLYVPAMNDAVFDG